MKTLARLVAATAALALAGTLAACGGGSPQTDAGPSGAPTTVDTEAPLYDELPQRIKDAGVIQVGSSIEYAPMEYYDTDGKTVLGFDKEHGDLLSAQVGVPFEWNNSKFDGLITQLNSNRFDMLSSAMTDNPERQQQVDFVDYYRAGLVLITQKGNPEGISSPDDLCGTTVAVMRGTAQDQYMQQTVQPQCESAGDPIELLAFDSESEALLQVKQGRADAGMQDYPVAVYNVQQSGDEYEIVGEQVESNPLGLAFRKDDTELRDVMQKAVQATMDDGSYQELIEKYDTPQGALDEATINAGK